MRADLSLICRSLLAGDDLRLEAAANSNRLQAGSYIRLCVWAFVLTFATHAHAQATIEGRVELPKIRSTPVVNQRYEIVTKGGVLATNPPLAVVYLEGSFPQPAAPAVAEITQKD